MRRRTPDCTVVTTHHASGDRGSSRRAITDGGNATDSATCPENLVRASTLTIERSGWPAEDANVSEEASNQSFGAYPVPEITCASHSQS